MSINLIKIDEVDPRDRLRERLKEMIEPDIDKCDICFDGIIDRRFIEVQLGNAAKLPLAQVIIYKKWYDEWLRAHCHHCGGHNVTRLEQLSEQSESIVNRCLDCKELSVVE